MSLIGILLVISFCLLALTIIVLAIDGFTNGKYQFLGKKYPWLGACAALFYLAGSLVLFFDNAPWNKFKSEVLVLLLIYILAIASFPLAGKKKQALVHYLIVFVLALVFAAMNMRWSGFWR